MQFLDI